MKSMADVLTVSEVARELGIAEQTVRQLADRGALPAQRTGSGQRIFQRADITKAKERRAAQGDNEAA
jgi:excisionase family DNA binding protein